MSAALVFDLKTAGTFLYVLLKKSIVIGYISAAPLSAPPSQNLTSRCSMSVAVLPPSSMRIYYLQARFNHLPQKLIFILFKGTQVWIMSAVLLFFLNSENSNARTCPPLKTTKLNCHVRLVSFCLTKQSKKMNKNTHVLPALLSNEPDLMTVRRHVHLI